MAQVIVKEAYQSAFTEKDLIPADVTLSAGIYNRVGAYTVQAGEAIELGYGSNGTQSDATGRIYMLLKSSSAEIKGTVRLTLEDAQGRVLRYIAEYRTEALSASTDRTKQIPFPMTHIVGTEDKKFVLEFKPDAAATLAKAQSVVTMDITRMVVA